MFYRKASAAATLQRGHVPPSFRGVHPFPLQQGSEPLGLPSSIQIHTYPQNLDKSPREIATTAA